MESLAYTEQFNRMKGDVTSVVEKALDVQSPRTKRRLRATKVWIDDSLDSMDFSSQRESVRKDRTWGIPVYASVELLDTETGKVLSTKSKMRVATLPKPTAMGSFIVNGKHYQVKNQLRRKPGIYVVEGADREPRTEVHVVGRPMKFRVDPQTSRLTIEAGNRKIALYPVLSRLGVSDAMMEKAWGSDVLAANKAVSGKKAAGAVQSLAEVLTSTKYESPDDAARAVREYLEERELSPSITRATLGKEFKRVTPEAMLRGTQKLLQVSAGKVKADEPNALEFKKVLSMSDLFRERLVDKDGFLSSGLTAFRGTIAKKIGNQRNRPEKVDQVLTPGLLSPPFTKFFTSSSLANTTDQTNPLSMINGLTKWTILGDGGIADHTKARRDEPSVHPSQLGFLDPIHTPDSENVGLTGHLPVGAAKKGEDLVQEVVDAKTGRGRDMTPADARRLVVAFPDQYNGTKPKSRRVKAIVNGEHQVVDAKDVDVILRDPKAAFSIASNMVPFLPSANGVRAQMATKMSEQAIPLTNREAPLVQVDFGDDTLEELIGRNFSIRSEVAGKVTKVSPSEITVETKDEEVTHSVYDRIPLNNKSFIESTNRVQVGDKVKKGAVLADSNFTDNGKLALGTNLRAAYMTWKGYNFEDGIVITESAAKKLSSEHLREFQGKNDRKTILSLARRVEAKNNLTAEQMAKMDQDGVIKKGAKVSYGDPLIVGVRDATGTPDYEVAARLGGIKNPFFAYEESWKKEADGVVVDVVKNGPNVKVYVKTTEPAQIGDKLTNRHAAKGIITKIIPDGEAPRDKSGKPVDILLNPHGIVGRLNPSQMLETAASKLGKPGKPYAVDNFSGENYVAEIKRKLKQAGLSDKEALYDAKTNKKLGDVLVGQQHILKLDKQATEQLKSRAEGKYDADHTPLKGGEEGAKGVGMLEFYSMLSHGSKHNLREMGTYKGTQNQEFWNWLQAGTKGGLFKPPPKPTGAYKKFEAYMRGAGVNMERNGSKLALGPLTDKQVERISNGAVKDAKFLIAKNLKEEKGGFVDLKIFGGKRGDRWGHIELPEAIPNPLFEEPIKSLTRLQKAQFEGLVQGRLFVNPKTGDFAEKGVTSGEAIKVLLSKVSVDDEIQSTVEEAKKAADKVRKGKAKSAEDNLDKANKRLRYLRALKKLNLRPEDAYVQKKIPVVPPKFRQIAPLPDGTLTVPGLNKLYRDVKLVADQLEWQNSKDFIPDDISAELRKDVYNGVKAVVGVDNPITKYYKPPKGIARQIAGDKPKTGFFHEKVLKRQQNLVGRGTIIPEPKLGVDEVGLPEKMSWNIFQPFIVRRLVNQAGYTPTKASDAVRDKTPLAREMLEQEMRARPVLLNRAPSLHKFSIMAFKPRITDGNAIKIPPLVVKGFNADFDGDAMTVHVPVLDEAVNEARSMIPSSNLFNPGSMDVMIRPQHEAALGLYLMSREAGGKKKILAELPDKLRAKYKDEVFNKKVLGRLLEDLGKEHPNSYGSTVDKLKAMGDEKTYSVGFTVGLDDLTPSVPERQKIFKKTEDALTKLDRTSPAGKKKAQDIIEKANKELDGALAKRLSQQDNNFHLMVSSGSRGSPVQLKQIISSPFDVPDHKGESQTAPIYNSYAEGLKFSDYWSTLYGARATAVDKQLQTATPGAFNKDIMASAVTAVISDVDCGTSDGIELPVEKMGDLQDRYLAGDVRVGGRTIGKSGAQVTTSVLNSLRQGGQKTIKVRSPLTCKRANGICSRCYGLNEEGQAPEIGDNVGAASGQALSEPLTQMTMQTFHKGGVSGGRSEIEGYEKIQKLFTMEKSKRGKATLATVAGKVDKIEDLPGGGGKNVYVDGKKHFVERDLFDRKKIRVGTEVQKGDIMSKGVVQPQELVDLKGLVPSLDYMSGEIQEAYQGEGVNLRRRAVETVLRAVGNTTRILDPGDSEYNYGDVAPHSVVEDFNRKSLGKINVDDAIGHTLREPVDGLRQGKVLTDLDVIMLKRMGKRDVEVGPKPIRKKDFIAGVRRVPVLRRDWMSQMGYRGLVEAMRTGAQTAGETDIHGYSPVPAFAYGAEFGMEPADKRGTGVY